MTITLSSRGAVVLLVGLLSLGFLVAAHEPANQMNVAASESEEVFVEDGETQTVLEETLRVSNPTDLILGVTAECSILSELKTQGSDSQDTTGQLKLHLTIDGQHVPISDEDADEGRVVFCDRTYQRSTTFGEDEEAEIEDYLETRTANAFNWVALDAGWLDTDGDGLLSVALHVEYEEASSDLADSTGVIGNRTLVIQPTRAKNDEERSSEG